MRAERADDVRRCLSVQLATLFAHECLRVFADRLVTESDLAIFYKHLHATTNSYFKVPLDISNLMEHPLLFCNFLKSDDRLYQQLNDWRQCCPILLDYQMRHNLNGHSTLKMVFFKEAVEHVLRISRVLQQPGGHLLLIGLDGTGRRTCLELGAFISGHILFQLNLKRGYAHEEFRDDLKLVGDESNGSMHADCSGIQIGHRSKSTRCSVHPGERFALG